MPISNDSTETIVHRWCCWCLSAIVCKIQMFVSIRLPNQTISNSLYATTIFPYCFNSFFSALFCDSFSKLHVQLEYKLVLAQRKKRSSTKSSNTFRCGVCIEKSRTKPSSQMAENNFNFLQNIPICIEEEEELLLTALEALITTMGKWRRRKSFTKTFKCTHAFCLENLLGTFSISAFQKCSAAIYVCSRLIFVQFEQLSIVRRAKIANEKGRRKQKEIWTNAGIKKNTIVI